MTETRYSERPPNPSPRIRDLSRALVPALALASPGAAADWIRAAVASANGAVCRARVDTLGATSGRGPAAGRGMLRRLRRRGHAIELARGRGPRRLRLLRGETAAGVPLNWSRDLALSGAGPDAFRALAVLCRMLDRSGGRRVSVSTSAMIAELEGLGVHVRASERRRMLEGRRALWAVLCRPGGPLRRLDDRRGGRGLAAEVELVVERVRESEPDLETLSTGDVAGRAADKTGPTERRRGTGWCRVGDLLAAWDPEGGPAAPRAGPRGDPGASEGAGTRAPRRGPGARLPAIPAHPPDLDGRTILARLRAAADAAP